MGPGRILPLGDRVLYRDGLILVIDKPAGIAVHAGPGRGPNLESGFEELRFGLPHPPALAHRLDRDTSGCLVLGRHPKALRRLGALFAAGKVRDVIGRHPKETVVVVGHDSVNRVVLLHALDLPLSRYRRLGQNPCAINEIDFSAGEFTVRSVNGTYHLEAQG